MAIISCYVSPFGWKILRKCEHYLDFAVLRRPVVFQWRQVQSTSIKHSRFLGTKWVDQVIPHFPFPLLSAFLIAQQGFTSAEVVSDASKAALNTRRGFCTSARHVDKFLLATANTGGGFQGMPRTPWRWITSYLLLYRKCTMAMRSSSRSIQLASHRALRLHKL